MTKPDDKDTAPQPGADAGGGEAKADAGDSGPVIDVTPEAVDDAVERAAAGAEEEAEEEEAAAGAQRRLLWRAVAVLALVAVVAVAGASYVFGPRLLVRLDRAAHLNGLPLPEANERIASIEARLKAIEDRIARPAREPLAESLVPRLDAAEAQIGKLATDAAALSARIGALTTRPTAEKGGEAATAGLSTRLSARLDAVERRLKAVASGGGANTAALEAEIADLRRRAAALEDRLRAAVAKLEGEIAALARKRAGAASASAALVLAVAQLRDAARGSGPFATALEAVRRLAGDDAALAEPLATLAQYAATGAPSQAVLRARFSALADKIVRAAAAETGGDWTARTLARLESLVTVRKLGEVEGDSAEAVVARAESRLDLGDLAAAVAEVEKLSGAPAEVAAGWLADARKRLAVDRAVAALAARGAAALGGG